MPDLSDAEFAAEKKLDRDRYPRVPRLEQFRSAPVKLDPSSVPKPLAPRSAAARAGGLRERRRAAVVIPTQANQRSNWEKLPQY
jgi:hypothetical protein